MQIDKVENMVHDDINLMAERQKISVADAKKRYNDVIESVAIPLKKNGDEVGLNKIIGYAPEKYQIMRDLLVPLKFDKTDEAGLHPVPNGMLLYGPKNTGKTHIAKAIGEHAKEKFGNEKVEFKEFMPGSMTKNDNGVELMEFFYDAETTYNDTGRRQLLLFDDMDEFLDPEISPEVTAVFLAMTDRCADRGITWIGTVNKPENMPDALFKPFRLNSDININKTSNAEKSAVMSYMWRQKERLDKTDHAKLLKEYDKSFNFYPPEMKAVADSTDEYLSEKVDKNSLIHHAWNGTVKEKSPVETPIVEKHIDAYKSNSEKDKFDNVELKEEQVNDEDKDKLLVYAKRYALRNEKPLEAEDE